jgi:hypothetical protein
MTGAPPARRRARPARPVAAPAAGDVTQRERWAIDAGARDVAVLAIPAHARRERSFEIYCRLVVRNPGGHADATHALRVHVDGALEWSRTVTTQPDGDDSLDLRLRRTVAAGQALRITARAETRRAMRQRLTIAAEED